MDGKGWRKVADFFGLKRSILGLLSMVILVGMGEKMAERFLPIYLVALGASAQYAGFLNGMDNLLSALYSFPGGYLSDRLGTKKSLLVFNLIAMLGFIIVLAVPHWIAVFVGSVFFLSWTAISLPATMELVAQVLPKNKRTMGVSVHSLVRRIPMAIGPIFGGLLIDYFVHARGENAGRIMGVQVAFGVALLFAVVALLLQQHLLPNDPPRKSHEKAPHPFAAFREMNRYLRSLLVSDILIRFCEQIPYAYIAIWCMNIVKINGATFGVLTAIEMATAILCYIPVAYLADKGNKKPFVVATFCFFTAFPLVLLFSKTMPLLVIAFIVRGLKEFGEPTRKALIMDLAPEGRKAAVFGAYYLMRDTVVSVAAFASGLLWIIPDMGGIEGLGPKITMLTAFGFGVLGTAWFAVFGRDLSTADLGKKTN